MKASEGMQFIEDMERQGIKPEAAKRIVSLVESQQGELATKADIEQLKEGQRRLEAGLNDQKRGNRWAIGLLASAIIGGLTLFGVVLSFQISDIRADIRLLLQSQQTTERAGQDRGN